MYYVSAQGIDERVINVHIVFMESFVIDSWGVNGPLTYATNFVTLVSAVLLLAWLLVFY